MNRRSFISAAIAFAAAAVAGVPKAFGARPSAFKFKGTIYGTASTIPEWAELLTKAKARHEVGGWDGCAVYADDGTRAALDAMIERDAKSYSEAREIILRAQADGLIASGSWIDPTMA